LHVGDQLFTAKNFESLDVHNQNEYEATTTAPLETTVRSV